MRLFFFQHLRLPGAILFTLILSHGLLAPYLGYYGNDWLMLAIWQSPPLTAYRAMFESAYPLGNWFYSFLILVLGTTPFAWQLAALSLRALAATFMWVGLKSIWPDHQRQAALMALLFIIYPAFESQATALSNSIIWIVLIGYFASVFLMIQSLRAEKHRWIIYIFSLIVVSITYEMSGATIGLEILRPFILYFALEGKWRRRIVQVMKLWLPYGFLICYSLFIRTYWSFPLFGLTGQEWPVVVSVEQLQSILQDTFYLLGESWYQTIRPEGINFLDLELWISLLIGALVAFVACLIACRKVESEKSSDSTLPVSNFSNQAMFLGGLGVLSAPLPLWFSGQQAYLNSNASHGFLLSSIGASILVIAILEWLVNKQRSRLVVILLLFLFATAYQVRKTNDYRWEWTKQQRYYWQMIWRAPDILPGTLLISDTDLFKYTDERSMTYALGLLYPDSNRVDSPGIWYVKLDKAAKAEILDRPASYFGKEQFKVNTLTYAFESSMVNSVIVDFMPEEGRCLRIISSLDEYNPDYSAYIRRSAGFSNLERILMDQRSMVPSVSIFGSEPQHPWCYFFQKASLAVQAKDWTRVVSLADQAQSSGFSPNDPVEWLPFVEGYAFVDRWNKALELSDLVFRGNRLATPQVCALLDRLLSETNAPTNVRVEVEARKQKYNCQD